MNKLLSTACLLCFAFNIATAQETVDMQMMQKIKDEERKRVAEEKRIEEEAIKKAEEKFKPQVSIPQATTSQEPIAFKETVSIKESYSLPNHGQPFCNSNAEPFNNDIKTIFTVTGSNKELKQVEMYMNSIGLSFERNDY